MAQQKIFPLFTGHFCAKSRKNFIPTLGTLLFFFWELVIILLHIESENGRGVTMKKYKARIADEILKKRLMGKGAVLIEGPKWCGKTTTAEQIAGSVLYMADPEKESQNLTMADINPKPLYVPQIPVIL